MHVQLSSIVAAAASCVGAAALASARIHGGWKNLPTLALAYASLNGFVISLAATPALANRNSASLLGKREHDGSLPLWSLAAFAPFHLGLRAKLAFQRAVGTESVWDEVMPLPLRGGGGRRRSTRQQRDNSKKPLLPYYLGGWPHEVDALPPGVTAVVDVTAELPRIGLRSSSGSPAEAAPARYLNLRTWDTHGPSPGQIERGVRWITEMRSKGGRKVLVHCAHGHGRSVTVLAAALLAERRREEEEEEEEEERSSCRTSTTDDDEKEVLKHIQQFRPKAKLNARQRGALQAWLREERKKKNVKK